MNRFAYYNGRFLPSDEVKIPLTDRALYFGDGVYEVILLLDGSVYQMNEHYSRLCHCCRRLGIPLVHEPRELLSIIYRLADLCSLDTASVYLQVTRGCSRRMHEIEAALPSNLLITLSPYELREYKEVSAVTVRDDRYELCDLKTLNLLCSVLALDEARSRGADCAIFVRDGIVTEECRSNLFIFSGGVLSTHPLDSHVLPGITRQYVIRAAGELSIPVSERKFTVKEMMDADEVFVSSTTKPLYRVIAIDGIPCQCKAKEVFCAIWERVCMDFFDKTV